MSEATINRTVLPIRRQPFGGETKKTLEGSVPDWDQASHVEGSSRSCSDPDDTSVRRRVGG
jgi:hypothetical protein